MNDDAQVLALHALDRLPGPNHLQFPNGFDHTAAMVRATRLKERLTGLPACVRAGRPHQRRQLLLPHRPSCRGAEAGVAVGVRLSNFEEEFCLIGHGSSPGRATWWTRYIEHL
ncbi:hypothetical protein ABT203_14815 [Streptomyces sp900105245]|uniref:hypothetical protein n=1 Tax=Streptomyces sp. 900105245 TaxID=3154379 RepID=UPI00332ABBF7